MHLRHFALFFIILALVSIPSTAKMFDLGNYTIDTGSYLLPHDAAVVNGSLTWHRISQEFTVISTGNESNFLENTTNLSDEYVGDLLSLSDIFVFFRQVDNSTTPENLTYFRVSKPCRGFVALSTRYPTVKFYAGSIDRFNVLVIMSSESDERMIELLQNLKIYTKDQGRVVRLQSIQKEVEGSSS